MRAPSLSEIRCADRSPVLYELERTAYERGANSRLLIGDAPICLGFCIASLASENLPDTRTIVARKIVPPSRDHDNRKTPRL